jgi:hypothetical protein
MTAYRLSLTTLRLVAIGFLFHALYTWAVFLLIPLPQVSLRNTFQKIADLQQDVAIRGSLLSVGAASLIFILAPILSRLVALGEVDQRPVES